MPYEMSQQYFLTLSADSVSKLGDWGYNYLKTSWNGGESDSTWRQMSEYV
jgi:hypothetical protein